jgi:hypothetical protein
MMNDTKQYENFEEQRIRIGAEIKQDKLSDIKKEINNLIWMYAPENLTLGEAETIAVKITDMIISGTK